MDNTLFCLLAGLAGLVLFFGGAFLLLKYYLDRRPRRPEPVVAPRPPEVSVNGGERALLLPLRVQACERLVLLLERMHPASLAMRLNRPEMPAAALHAAMVSAIREEFDYNLSQQLFVPSGIWDLIRNAREETVAMINQAASGLGDEAPSQELVKRIFDSALTRGKLPVETALGELKADLQKLF